MKTARASILLAAGLLLAGPAAAYNGYAQEDEGFFIFLDAALTTPGNTDQVVAFSNDLSGLTQGFTPLAMDWGSGVAGKFGVGYRWGASSISVSYWQFSDDESLRADGPNGGEMQWTIGPASYFNYYGVYYPIYTFATPGHVDFKAELDAATFDVDFKHAVPVGDLFDLEWSVGLRYATFEEKIEGVYDVCATTGCQGVYGGPPFNLLFGDARFDARKTNEGDMFGVKAGIGGTYFATDSLAIASQISFSVMTGEVESRSGLTPSGLVNSIDPPTLAVRTDDARTGNIGEIDVGLRWYLAGDRVWLSLGYRHAFWDDIAADLLRNTPGILTANRDRDKVTFSGPYLGLRWNF